MIEDHEVNPNEEPRIHTTSDGVVWRRTGYCCQCGECCIGCPVLLWITENVRGVCKEKLLGIPQSCGQDDTWPPTPAHISNLKKCTYKFEEVTQCTT